MVTEVRGWRTPCLQNESAQAQDLTKEKAEDTADCTGFLTDLSHLVKELNFKGIDPAPCEASLALRGKPDESAALCPGGTLSMEIHLCQV